MYVTYTKLELGWHVWLEERPGCGAVLLGEPDVHFSLPIPCALRWAAFVHWDLARVLESLPAPSRMVGDVNIDLNPHNNSFHNHTTKSYMEVLDNFKVVNTITTPTRYGYFKSSIIDHIAVNRFKHCGLFIWRPSALYNFHWNFFSICQYKSKHTIFTKTNNKALRNKVEEHDWSRIIDPCNVQIINGKK